MPREDIALHPAKDLAKQEPQSSEDSEDLEEPEKPQILKDELE